jgi:Ni/Co efflux regulator RcnB
MKKILLSAAFLGLLAVGTVNAQDQDKKTKQDPTKTDQPTDMKKDNSQDPNKKQQEMSNDQKQNQENQKAYDPNQQPTNPAPKTDTAVTPAQ